MALSLEELLGSPDHYLHSFDGTDALFVPMDRAAYRRSIFLDRRISLAGDGLVRLPVDQLGTPVAEPINWIFHIAHCGSTLLARALDELEPATVLREPLALRQLALLPGSGPLLAPTLGLLSRRYPGAAATLIKANVPVNFMLDQIVPFDPQARAIFLYSTLPDYLCAVLRSGQHRSWVRGVTAQLADRLGPDLPGTDATLAALLWHAQISRFGQGLAVLSNARCLDFETFLGRPADTLMAASELYGYSARREQLDRVVSGPLFNTYSKNPEHAFDNAMRLARREAALKVLGAEIAFAQDWLERRYGTASDCVAALVHASLLG